MGVCSRAEKVSEFDAVSVRLIKDQGGIPFVKGNLSEVCANTFWNNEVWGLAKHPLNNDRTPGGSSGGDAAMLADGVSPFALGTDFGGSIRIPSNFCGITGFVPTMERQSIRGLSWYVQQDGIYIRPNKPVIGPMGRWVDDLVDGMKCLFSENLAEYDTSIPKMPFDQESFDQTCNKKLKVGIISNIAEIWSPGPASKRALNICIDKLKDAGHEIIEFEMVDLKQNYLSWVDALLNEAMPLIYDHMYEVGDKLSVNLHTLLFMFNSLPKFMTQTFSFIARMLGLTRLAEILNICHVKDIDQIVALNKVRYTFAQEVTKTYVDLGLDCILVHGFPIAAYKIDDAPECMNFAGTHMLFNHLQYPSGALPVTTVEEGEDSYDNPLYKDNTTTAFGYTAKDSVGMPVGVLVGAMSWKDEKALAAMKVIEDLIKQK